jgi:hypothetical protein
MGRSQPRRVAIVEEVKIAQTFLSNGKIRMDLTANTTRIISGVFVAFMDQAGELSGETCHWALLVLMLSLPVATAEVASLWWNLLGTDFI